MFLYVVDHWTQQGGDAPTATRPWSGWHQAAIPSNWNPELSQPVEPLFSEFRTPAVIVIHWSYLTARYRPDECAKKKLNEIVSLHADFCIVVISAEQLGQEGSNDRMYFRKAPVHEADEFDPFRTYLCEFFSHYEKTSIPDFTLLEPEPAPIALLRAHTGAPQLVLDATWRDAQHQCKRIISRGDGYGPFMHPDFAWLDAAVWPEDFLRSEDSQLRFKNAISELLTALRIRQSSL